MLKHTFVHIGGVGRTIEARLWNSGIESWDHFLDRKARSDVPRPVLRLLDGHVERSCDSLLRRDAAYFEKLLPGSEHWRLYHEFSDSVAFLDIETTGLGGGNDCITVIGLYDGRRAKVFVKGKNLSDFPEEIRKYSLLVTYNGRQFDLPFIRNTIGPLPYQQGHIDLRYPLRALGYSGGLKSIENQLGLQREGALQGVDGYVAVLLWQEHLAGNKNALPTLIRYNLEDVVNLRYLAEVTYNMAVSRLPIHVPALAVRPEHELEMPFEADAALVRRLKAWIEARRGQEY